MPSVLGEALNRTEPMQELLDSLYCEGRHRYFVANSAAAEGKVFVFIVCTACGHAMKHEFEVAKNGSSIALEK